MRRTRRFSIFMLPLRMLSFGAERCLGDALVSNFVKYVLFCRLNLLGLTSKKRLTRPC